MSTLASDDFNRGNENPIAGNWTTGPGFSAMALTTNAIIAASANDSGSYYNAVSFPANQWAQCTLTSVKNYTSNGDGDGPMVRCITSGTTKTDYEVTAGSGRSTINRRDGTGFSIIATGGGTFSNGDVAYLEAQGTTIIAKKNGTQIMSVTNADVASGAAGAAHSDEGIGMSPMDDWSAGDFAGAATKAPPIFAAQRGPRFIRSRKVI